MPKKLSVVVILFLVSIGFSFQQQAYVSAVVSGLLLAGVIKGNDGIRKFIIGLAFVQIAWALFGITQILVYASFAAVEPVFWAYTAVAIGVPAFLLWAMSQEDVREWMFRRAFNLEQDPIPQAQVHGGDTPES